MSEKNVHTLSLLEKLTSIQQQKFLRHCDKEFLRFCCECAINVVNGTVGINVDELKQYEIQLRLLCKRSTSNKKRRKILMSPKSLNYQSLLIGLVFVTLQIEFRYEHPRICTYPKKFLYSAGTLHTASFETPRS